MESNKKKTLILMIVAVTVFVALIVGATYAYYSVNVSGSNAKTTITAQTEGGGSIVLTTPVTDLKLELLGDEMDENNKNKEYYATIKDDSKGYASDLTSGTHEIAKIEVASSTEGSKYDCSASVKITLDISDDTQMGKVLQKDDLVLNILGYPELDLYDLHETGEDTIPVTFRVKSGEPTILKMYAKLTNKNENQNYLADKELNITVETQDLKCSVVKPFVTGTGAELAHSDTKNLTDNLIGDMYRYIGENPDNYICFGSNSCTEGTNKDNFLYRIIGIDSNGRLKLIKNKALTSTYAWHSSNSEDAKWDKGKDIISSTLYTNINGIGFIDNTTLVPNSWKEKISLTSWNIGDIQKTGIGYTTTGNEVYQKENEIQSNTLSKIGLMYLSDYYYSLDGTGNLDCYTTSKKEYEMCKTSWLHISNNGTSDTTPSYEWTMTRYGLSSSDIYSSMHVYANGYITWDNFNYASAIRPVFYLSSDSVIKDGIGTSSDPYILESPEETGKRLAVEKFGSVPEGFKTTPIADLYRFVGTTSNQPKNYICFGTTNKEECKTTSSDKYLYRIIGIDEDGRLKLIKDTALSTGTEWHSNYTDNAVWDAGSSKTSAKLYMDLNNTTFLNNTTYVPIEGNWKEKIDETNWYIGDSNGDNAANGDAIWEWEQKKTASTASKIGLMYLSDYYYSLDGTGSLNCRQDSNCPTCKTTWIHLTSNSSSQNYVEWTMSRYGYSSSLDDYYVWYMHMNGYVYWTYLNITNAVRPVFYLTSDVKLTTQEGSSYAKGSLENPWIVELQ